MSGSVVHPHGGLSRMSALMAVVYPTWKRQFGSVTKLATFLRKFGRQSLKTETVLTLMARCYRRNRGLDSSLRARLADVVDLKGVRKHLSRSQQNRKQRRQGARTYRDELAKAYLLTARAVMKVTTVSVQHLMRGCLRVRNRPLDVGSPSFPIDNVRLLMFKDVLQHVQFIRGADFMFAETTDKELVCGAVFPLCRCLELLGWRKQDCSGQVAASLPMLELYVWSDGFHYRGSRLLSVVGLIDRAGSILPFHRSALVVWCGRFLWLECCVPFALGGVSSFVSSRRG